MKKKNVEDLTEEIIIILAKDLFTCKLLSPKSLCFNNQFGKFNRLNCEPTLVMVLLFELFNCSFILG